MEFTDISFISRPKAEFAAGADRLAANEETQAMVATAHFASNIVNLAAA